MKTPFQAFYIESQRAAMIPSVMVRPCVVTALLPSTQMAIIDLHSLMVSGRVSKVVPFADLASTEVKAIEEATVRIRKLPVLAIKKYSEADEKSAAVHPLAGAASG